MDMKQIVKSINKTHGKVGNVDRNNTLCKGGNPFAMPAVLLEIKKQK